MTFDLVASDAPPAAVAANPGAEPGLFDPEAVVPALRSDRTDVAPRGLPPEQTLSVDERWAYPGGNFGVRLSQNLLDDPRIRDLTAKTLGVLVLIRAHWELGRPISAKPAYASRDLGLTRQAWANCLDELTLCVPPLVEIRQQFVLPMSYGKPIPKEVSEVRSIAALARSEKVKRSDGVARPPEPAPVLDAEAQAQSDFFNDAIQDCPYEEIMNLFSSICVRLPKPLDVRKWPATRKRRVQAIWKDNPSLDFWRKLFIAVNSSDFLCANEKWQASFDWIIQPSNLLKIREGNYNNRSPRATSAGGDMFRGGRFAVGQYGSHDIPVSAPWLPGAQNGRS